MSAMPGFSKGWRGRFATGSLASLMTVLIAVTPAAGQAAPTSPPPQGEVYAPPPASGPVEPVTTAPTAGAPPFAPAPVVVPSVPLAPLAPVPPSQAMDAPPVAVSTTTDHSPFSQRWWFWTALGAFAVTAVVIIAASSGPDTPKTDFGNMPAF
jgi:hypothetical protein